MKQISKAIGLFLVSWGFSLGAKAQVLAPPEKGAYIGAFMDFGATASDVSAERIDRFQELSQQKSTWAYFANDWLDGKIEFPEQQVKVIASKGLIPYIRMMPWSRMQSSAHSADPIFKMQFFLDGRFDEPLRLWFQKARDWGQPLMVEFGPEANGDWFPWNGKWNGESTRDRYGDPRWPDGPERFRDVFRRIVRLSREEKALNITWVFHVDTAYSPEASWNEARYYYPGDEFVDWIGLSVFGAQLPTHSWSYFHSKLKRFVPQLEALDSENPWLVSEAAVIEDAHQPNRKAEWIRQALQSIELGLFKKIKGFSYWHSPGWLSSGRASFQIDTSDEALQAYRKEVTKPFWRPEMTFR